MARQKYFWTPELDARLRVMYADAKNKLGLSKGITQFMRSTGFSRHIIRVRAADLGITTPCTKKPWSEAETRQLLELLGTVPVRKIARILNRSPRCVISRAHRLQRIVRVREGYSQNELCELFGAPQQRVARWVANGWMRVAPPGHNLAGRIPESQVQQFIRNHADEYDLRRVDEPWFKGMIFPNYGMSIRPRSASIRVDDQEETCA
jgi:hypothetical protein